MARAWVSAQSGLALVAMIPWPPGGKALFALAIILMAVQLTLLRHEVWLPVWAGKASVSRGFYRSASGKIMGMVRHCDACRPRRVRTCQWRTSKRAVGSIRRPSLSDRVTVEPIASA